MFLNHFFRAHMERMKALEKGETIEVNCKSTVDDNVEDDPSGVSATALTVSVLSALFLPLFV